jgi:predicted metal-dependent HD superfamily phosphohydrolase
MPREAQLADLAELWDRLMDSLGVAEKKRRMHAFAQLVASYSESHRYWHNLDHVESLLAHVKLPQHHLNDDLASVELAVWYHDAVYDPRSTENEIRSAQVAMDSLRELKINEDRIARVCALVLMTKDHQAPQDDRAAQIFLDADMSILGTNPILYAEYADDIRKEYAWVPDKEYCLGRREVLRDFSKRSAIFQTEWFKQWESAVRTNLAAEIARIDEKLAAMGVNV